MNISPISNFSYRALNFKGGASNPIDDSKKSLQNNGEEVKISPEQYMAMFTQGALNRFEEYGMFEVDEEDGAIELSSEFDLGNEEFDQAEMAANMAIMTLKTAAAQMGASVATRNNIPTFVNFDYNNYIFNLENSIKEAKEQIADMDLPDVDELPDMMELIETDEALNPELLAQRALAYLPEMIEGQEALLEKFKTTKAQGIKEALKECSSAHNLMFFRAIQHGFEGNARGVVADLTANFEMYNKPEITDNNDGTTTYLYADMLGAQYKIIRNSDNGDYISAICMSLDKSKGFELDFNPDGSIKRLDYLNGVDKSLVSISQKGNRVIAKQIFNNFVTERRFVKSEDNSLRQTYTNIYVK